MRHQPRIERARLRGPAAGLLALAAGAAIFGFGGTPWLLIVVVIVLLTLLFGQRSSWPFAFSSAVVTLAFGAAVVIRLAPVIGVPLFVSSLIALVLLGLLALGILSVMIAPRLPGRRTVGIAAPALVVPALAVAGMSLAVAAGHLSLTWAMRNDAVWNLVSMRFIIEDDGVLADLHPSSSPLTAALMAIAASVGRSAIAPGDLLAHDMIRTGELWLVLVFASVILAGLIGLRSTRGAPRPMRYLATIGAGLIPLGWYAVGFAFEFGFSNSTLALVLLLASWLAWLETRVTPLLGSASLSLATVALLATWAPLAAISGGLALAALGSRVTALVRQRGRGFFWWALAAIPVPFYIVIVTLPDLRRDGSALAVNGGMFDLTPLEYGIMLAVTAAVVVAFALRRGATHLLLGTTIVIGASVVGVGYLVVQRIAADVIYWGYYPAKMAWMSSCLLLVILAATLLSAVSTIAVTRPRLAVLGTVGAGGLVAALMVMNPPITPPPLANLAPFVNVVTGTGVAEGGDVARRLFEIATPDEAAMAVRLLEPEDDRFMNLWLLQLEADVATDDIRYFSYALDTDDDAQVCTALMVWDRHVKVYTSDPNLRASLDASCARADFEVLLDEH